MEGISSVGISTRVMSRQHKAEAMIAGEQLRLRLHFGKLIKDRRVHLRTYPNCFVAQELVDWLTIHKEVPDRDTAVKVMQRLMDHDIIHHVCDKWPMFKDAKLLYRFRKDDGTFPFSTEEKVFTRGQSLYEHLLSSRECLLQVREEKGVLYKRCFAGFQLIDWLLQNGEAESRSEGVELSRTLLEHGIIQHVSLKHHFFDSGLLYQFCVNFRRRRRLAELFEVEQDGEVMIPMEDQADSPFILRRTPPPGRNANFLSGSVVSQLIDLYLVHICTRTQFLTYLITEYLVPGWTSSANEATNDENFVKGGRRSSLTHQLHNSNGFMALNSVYAAPGVRSNPKSVLKRAVTCEELLSPGAPYIKKVLTILGDVLGWGFVVRGKSPCYVQAVDPGSPAAVAGVKVRQFVCRVNGLSVLHLDYCALSKLVMTGPRVVTLEVMEPQD
ncbi:DEP domain-containing mTOR-interacting protein [Colossoma macropomum]|uniref:DEP domain-containing mTOR-interacting protein n=1 Tax=Colossoma macropomum TaxID=42526 RepID=UPI0018644FAD|nr:DEP domain-containing mTOR-interacting protein [Colossoma macropomum]